jgi:hypothetical protein
MRNPTTPHIAGTPAAGGRFVGMRRRVVRAATGTVLCDECGTAFDEDRCPTCVAVFVSAWRSRAAAGPRRVRPSSTWGAPAAGTPECLHDTNLDQLVDLRQV